MIREAFEVWKVKGLIWLALFIFIVGSCSLMNSKLGIEDDNLLEETIESLVRLQSGIDLDITPGSKE